MGNLHIIAVLAFFEKSRYKNRAHTIIFYFLLGFQCSRGYIKDENGVLLRDKAEILQR